MCGISGFVKLKPVSGSAADLRHMMEAIQHRGPGWTWRTRRWKAFLGHRRLSIIDVAGGHQPMSNEDGSQWITFNGEIFNHASIRPELEAAGHQYVSRCDTETIIHAYEQYGPACVEKFRGMFAFAIWDSNRQKLFCARDRLGIKPFYYFHNDRIFAFASEIKALLRHPEIRSSFAEELLPEYLTLRLRQQRPDALPRHTEADARPHADARCRDGFAERPAILGRSGRQALQNANRTKNGFANAVSGWKKPFACGS